ncbi:hypothetical protein KAS79_04220 [Candidatus Parcubacteria bacterium]|nr:hypothetical protein [Candidatus Parcubacteria bacterium]
MSKFANIQTTPSSLSNERARHSKDTVQPWTKKGVNEKFIKRFGADNHPDTEVRDFYKKKGF